jgi:putative nucleotidyltransferase with HDIG domain
MSLKSIQGLEKEIKRLRHKLEGQDKEVKELHHVYMHTIKAFASAIDLKDHYTYDHSINVVKYAVAIAHQVKLMNHEIQDIKHACQLHDLGKIGVPDYILAKHGKLNKEEWEKVKIHTLKGAEILSPLKFLDGIIKLIVCHHERYDGKGYPKGLKCEKIPLGARIMLVADAFDAMTSDRPYRKKLSIEEAIEELKRNSGTQFDPGVVKAFLEVLRVEPGIVGIKGYKKSCFLLQASP